MTWSRGPDRHLVCQVTYVYRDAIFADLFAAWPTTLMGKQLPPARQLRDQGDALAGYPPLGLFGANRGRGRVATSPVVAALRVRPKAGPVNFFMPRRGPLLPKWQIGARALWSHHAPIVGYRPGRRVREDVFLPDFDPSKIARATDSGEAFGTSRPRDISVSTGPARTAWTLTPCPAKRARKDCVKERAAAFDAEYAGITGRAARAAMESTLTTAP